MSIESRLRSGLEANTSTLLPQVDHELGVVLRRASRRRRARVGAGGLVAAAALLVAGWLVGATTVDRGTMPPANPDDTRSGPIPMAGYEGPLEPGTYAVPTWGYGDEPGDTWPLAVVEVPAGYHSPGGWMVDAGYDGGSEATELGTLGFWYADEIVRDPCSLATETAPLGPTARDLTTALTRRWGAHIGTPVATTIGGHPGYYLTLTSSDDLDCRSTGQTLWTWGDDEFDLDPPARIFHLWILDVDGDRIIMVVALYPDQKPGQNAELITMARNAYFIDPPD